MSPKKDLIRCHIDFDDFSILCNSAQSAIINAILKDGVDYLAATYNDLWAAYSTGRPFKPYNFSVRHLQDGQRNILYITLPRVTSAVPVLCSHTAITFNINQGKYTDIRVFNVERSMFGTTAIGSMRVDNGNVIAHENYGEAGNTDDDNIARIYSIAFRPAA